MDYQSAKALQDELWDACAKSSKLLQVFPTGPMGLTPDSVTASPEFQAAKLAFDRSFQRLRAYNAWFNKQFKGRKHD